MDSMRTFHFESETNFVELQGSEKCFALDTAALLGGNEVMVSKIYQSRCDNEAFSYKEMIAVDWTLKNFWPDIVDLPRFLESLEIDGHLNQRSFHNLLPESAKRNIRRILSNCMLYCGRFPDTQVLQNTEYKTQRCLVINMTNFPAIEMPFGKVGNIDCKRLGIVYYKEDEDNPTPLSPPTESFLSDSWVLEYRMLRAIHFVAAIPLP